LKKHLSLIFFVFTIIIRTFHEKIKLAVHRKSFFVSVKVYLNKIYPTNHLNPTKP
jgi:hypothetical protein